MPLRADLQYQPPSPERAEAFLLQALDIAAMVEVGIDPAGSLAAFNAESGRLWRAEALLFMLRSGDLPALAVEAATPPPPALALEPEDLFALLDIIRDSEPPQAGWYIDLFEQAVGQPEAAALIHWPPDKRAYRRSGQRLSAWRPDNAEIINLLAGQNVAST